MIRSENMKGCERGNRPFRSYDITLRKIRFAQKHSRGMEISQDDKSEEYYPYNTRQVNVREKVA